MNQKEFVKSWTKNIRNHCDLLDNQIDRLIQPSDSQEQLDYVMLRLSQMNKRLHSFVVSPGKSKSYSIQVKSIMSDISSIQQELKIWNTEGIKPEYFDEPRKGSGNVIFKQDPTSHPA